jgi:hypothetical protein
MNWLGRIFGASAETAHQVGEGSERLTTIVEFLATAAEKITDSDKGSLAAAVDAALPWARDMAEAVGEAIPPIKLLLKIVSAVTKETDPRDLGLLAFTLAYQAAVADAAKQLEQNTAARGKLTARIPPADLKRSLRANLSDKPEDFEGFRLATVLGHPLTDKSDKALRQLAAGIGYSEDVQLMLIEGVHRRFVNKFQLIISDGRTKEKFEPLFRLITIEGRDVATFSAIERHMEYQLWRFHKAPVLGKGGPLSLQCGLKDIYVPLDAGVLRWEQIRTPPNPGVPGTRPNPFDENFGGRTPILEKTLTLIRDRTFDDAIVVQGVAGSGKSAFTLQLCAELRKLGLRPLRIRMRDLSLEPTMTLLEDMAQAIVQNSGDEQFDELMGPRPPSTDVDLNNMLEESVSLSDARVSPYVLIFDGWDEISVSASEGFGIRIAETLRRVRTDILKSRSHRVRVILTGRPSLDVNESKFLQKETPILTVRPFTTSQLAEFAGTLQRYRTKNDPNMPAFASGDLRPGIMEFIKQFDSDPQQADSSGILRLPLLALLALWLTLNDNAPAHEVLRDRTSLYRRLVDLTCLYGGNLERPGPAIARFTGDELRDLLRRTAAAMTVHGTESISYEELALRLDEPDEHESTQVISKVIGENPVTKLMLSFFFNAGAREIGCEFIHKSFREYLFAEAVIETLRKAEDLPEDLQRRVSYWKDFEEGDPRQGFVQDLTRLLAPQWITPEVARHLTGLIAWEVYRATARSSVTEGETKPLSLGSWQSIRDLIVDLWDWWAEGVHLRPQPYRRQRDKAVDFNEPYGVYLVKFLCPRDVPRNKIPEPVRTTTVDAHLGDAFFRLNCALHFEINRATGWLERPQASTAKMAETLWDGASSNGVGARKYQTAIEQPTGRWVTFAPSTPDGSAHYFETYCYRINAAGWRPESAFPSGINMSGIDLSGAALPLRAGMVKEPVILCYARLSGADLNQANLYSADLSFSFSREVSCVASVLSAARLRGADLRGAKCMLSLFSENDFSEADVQDAVFTGAIFEKVDLSTLRGAKVEKVFTRDDNLFD